MTKQFSILQNQLFMQLVFQSICEKLVLFYLQSHLLFILEQRYKYFPFIVDTCHMLVICFANIKVYFLPLYFLKITSEEQILFNLKSIIDFLFYILYFVSSLRNLFVCVCVIFFFCLFVSLIMIFIFSIIAGLQCSVNFYCKKIEPSNTYIHTFFFLYYPPSCSITSDWI